MNSVFLVKSAGKKGLGVFAKRDIRKGEFIALLSGPVRKRRTQYTVQVSPKNHVYPVNAVFRFACHSCSPNCGIGITDDFRIGLRAMKNIGKGEEITWDYAMTEDKFSYKMPCQCGSKNCRKDVDGYTSLDSRAKKKYRNHLMPYLRNK